jgi:hypothetical protein
MRALDPRKWLMDLMCIALIVVLCIGMLAAGLLVAVANSVGLLVRSLNPFRKEAVV